MYKRRVEAITMDIETLMTWDTRTKIEMEK